MSVKLVKSTEIFRFPLLKNHIEEFIAHGLPDILEELQYFDVIKGFCYTSRISRSFLRGIDFYIILGKKEIPVQITDNPEFVDVFSREGIRVIFLPEKNKRDEILYPEEQRIIVTNGLSKIIRTNAYLSTKT